MSAPPPARSWAGATRSRLSPGRGSSAHMPPFAQVRQPTAACTWKRRCTQGSVTQPDGQGRQHNRTQTCRAACAHHCPPSAISLQLTLLFSAPARCLSPALHHMQTRHRPVFSVFMLRAMPERSRPSIMAKRCAQQPVPSRWRDPIARINNDCAPICPALCARVFKSDAAVCVALRATGDAAEHAVGGSSSTQQQSQLRPARQRCEAGGRSAQASGTAGTQ